MPTPRARGVRAVLSLMMDATRRGNYESGSDYVLEYGELRFTFNERDFTERVEQAAIKLGFVLRPLEGAEREDLVNLAVNGEVPEPHSELGEHIKVLVNDAQKVLIEQGRRDQATRLQDLFQQIPPGDHRSVGEAQFEANLARQRTRAVGEVENALTATMNQNGLKLPLRTKWLYNRN